MVGTTLNHYRIERAIGKGGMGEVYAAEDTRLRRHVALKVLPKTYAEDADRRARFEREAQAVAALNHPGIVTIHSVEEAGPVLFLTMELVEGRTLADLTPPGGLTLERLLTVAIPLTDAIATAHARGIVHRDLKPANVMVTTDGLVKVLDFGLARLKETIAVGADMTTMPARELTGEGQIVGTVAYMSPEQAEARALDHRTDIFSLGVLLYELATGQRPFRGDSNLSVLSSILRDTPPPITELNPALPRELGRMVRRCLAKDPDRRYQSVKDLRNELQELQHELDSGELAASQAGAARARPIRRARAALLLAGALVAASLVFGTEYLRRAGSDEMTLPQARFQLQPPPGVAVGPDVAASGSQLAISPDGFWVAFRGGTSDMTRTGIYLRSVAELDARLVPGSAGDGYGPFFSPDSKWLGFFANGMIQKIRVGDTHPQRICGVSRLRGASWGDDGHIVFSEGEGLLRVSAAGGEPSPLTVPADPGDRYYWPQVLPGSKAAVFTLHQGFSDRWMRIGVVTLADGQVRILPLTGTYPRYLTSGHLAYSRLGTIHGVGFNHQRLEVTGEPRPILEDVYSYLSSGHAAFDVARTGALAYMTGAPRLEESELAWVDKSGGVSVAVDGKQPYVGFGLAISPTGDRVAALVASSLEDRDVWILGPGRTSTRLTFGMSAMGSLVWSPDGQWIVFSSARSGHVKLFRVRADGGTPEPLTTGVEWEHPGSFSPDGEVLIFMRQTEPSQWDVLTLRLEPRGAPEPFLATPALEAWPAFSPDGRWVAYESSETGTRQVHVRPYPGPGPRTTISLEGGSTPRWSPDGRELFYRRPNEVWSVPVQAGSTFTAGAPRLLLRSDFLRGVWDNRPAVSPDGRRLLFTRYPPPVRAERHLAYVPNWMQEVTRAIATGR